jgi:hypothetical protein
MSLRGIHNNWHGRQYADSRQDPGNDLNNLQLMTFRQSTLDISHSLVAHDHTPHLMNENTRDDPEDC